MIPEAVRRRRVSKNEADRTKKEERTEMGQRRREGPDATAPNGRDCGHAPFGVAGPWRLRSPSAPAEGAGLTKDPT